MNSIFLYALGANIVIGLCLILLIFLLNLVKDRIIKYIDYLTALTAGILLGIIFLGFLPEIVEGGVDGHLFGTLILFGIIGFYLFEIFLHFHHCKDLANKESSHHFHDAGALMFVGTLLHNLLHGIILFSAFSVNTEFGFGVSIAILLHSIPQNSVNYIMNHDNYKFVLLAAVSGVIGVLLLFPFVDMLINSKFLILSVISGSLMYLALSDLLPIIKDKKDVKNKFIYLIFVVVGLVLIFFVH